MSLVPVFTIGIWNAWILQSLLFLAMIIPDFFMGKEARKRSKKLNQFVPLKKAEKLLAFSTHVVIMPVVFVYSIFLPLKIGAPWLYGGLPVFAAALVISALAVFNAGATPAEEPVTRGVYRITRHPLYLSGFLAYLGMAICCASWPVLLCAVLWIVFWSLVAPAEEKHLVDKYGDAYREYSNRTPRWIGIPKAEKA